MTKKEAAFLRKISNDPVLIEKARIALEDILVDFRDSRISVLRNNGLCVKEKDGSPSHIIRMSIPDALYTALQTMAKEVE